jgi:hypothetical protein
VAGTVTFDTNGQNFVVKGLETSLVARVTRGLTTQSCSLLTDCTADPRAFS